MNVPVFRRADLISKVEEYHNANGGAPGQRNVTSATKKALQLLAAGGYLERTAVPGLWRWITPPEAAVEAALLSGDIYETDELDVTTDTIIEGDGSGSVYVYYFPNYKELADFRQKPVWPIKVGMTALGDAKIRISEQQGTAMPEDPVVAYVRKTDNPLRLERLIHSVLFFRGQQVEEAPGNEWFVSSPAEVKAIVDWAHETSTSSK